MSGLADLCRGSKRVRVDRIIRAMNRTVAEWLWRAAMLCALVWVGCELRSLHVDLMAPVDEVTSAEADPGELQSSLDDIRDALADLNRKVDFVIAGGRQ